MVRYVAARCSMSHKATTGRQKAPYPGAGAGNQSDAGADADTVANVDANVDACCRFHGSMSLGRPCREVSTSTIGEMRSAREGATSGGCQVSNVLHTVCMRLESHLHVIFRTVQPQLPQIHDTPGFFDVQPNLNTFLLANRRRCGYDFNKATTVVSGPPTAWHREPITEPFPEAPSGCSYALAAFASLGRFHLLQYQSPPTTPKPPCLYSVPCRAPHQTASLGSIYYTSLVWCRLGSLAAPCSSRVAVCTSTAQITVRTQNILGTIAYPSGADEDRWYHRCFCSTALCL